MRVLRSKARQRYIYSRYGRSRLGRFWHKVKLRPKSSHWNL